LRLRRDVGVVLVGDDVLNVASLLAAEQQEYLLKRVAAVELQQLRWRVFGKQSAIAHQSNLQKCITHNVKINKISKYF